MNKIRLFMWGYQQHFRILAQLAAERVFNRLDDRLQPELFLLGLLEEDLENRHHVCFEPESSDLKPQWFSNIQELAANYSEIDPRSSRFHSNPDMQQTHENRIKRNALRSAVVFILDRYSSDDSVKQYCSFPVLLQGYSVFVILQLNKECVERYYCLNRPDEIRVPHSLIEAVVDTFFDECASALVKSDPGAGLNLIERDTDEIIALAGRYLMDKPAYVSNLEGLGGLYHACNTIASLTYEGLGSNGYLIVGRPDHPNIELRIEFSEPIKVSEYSAVRKVLELCDDQNALVTDSAVIYGVGCVKGMYDPRNEDLFVVRFIKQHTWALYHADNPLMYVKYRQPRLPRSAFDRSQFSTMLSRRIAGITSADIEHLLMLADTATKQRHGALVVISSNAQQEAHRLSSQSTLIKPISLTNDLMSLVSSIDGAVLISPISTCYGIGVILDGAATTKGDRARGARYNSAVRYSESNSNCVAVVVSQDGNVDVLPDLRPQIRRSELEEVIEQLRALQEAETFDNRRFFQLIDWFKEHAFYLSQEQCNEINPIIQSLRNRDLDRTGWKISESDFKPNSEMSDEYFLDD